VSSPTLALALAPPRIRGAAAYRAALALAGSWLMAGLAQIEIKLPFTPVPFTGQTLGVLLVGASLGGGLGVASMLLYLAQGALGLPFFSGGDSGLEFLGLASATGGYLWGFVLAAFVVGRLAERGWDRTPGRALAAMLCGEIALYAIGVPWLAQAVNVSLPEAASLGLWPFIVGDALKLLLAGTLLPAAWWLTRRSGRPGR
jgi:biotin transport system substrate-specific component